MKNKRSVILMVLGGLCLAAALSLTFKNYVEEMRGERASARAEQILRQEVIPELAEGNEAELTVEKMQSVEIDGHEYIGVVDIPSMKLSLPVQNQWSETLLKTSPCRYSGSFMDDSMIIAGHNYKKHFNKIKYLQTGDTVTFTDVNGGIYEYAVSGIETIPGTDVKGMESGEWDLTLFTCTYGGKNRMAVRCSRTN